MITILFILVYVFLPEHHKTSVRLPTFGQRVQQMYVPWLIKLITIFRLFVSFPLIRKRWMRNVVWEGCGQPTMASLWEQTSTRGLIIKSLVSTRVRYFYYTFRKASTILWMIATRTISISITISIAITIAIYRAIVIALLTIAIDSIKNHNHHSMMQRQ